MPMLLLKRDIDCCKATNSEDIIPFKTMNTEKEETTHYSSLISGVMRLALPRL